MCNYNLSFPCDLSDLGLIASAVVIDRPNKNPAKDFLSSLLCRPDIRINVQQALDHPWLQVLVAIGGKFLSNITQKSVHKSAYK